MKPKYELLSRDGNIGFYFIAMDEKQYKYFIERFSQFESKILTMSRERAASEIKSKFGFEYNEVQLFGTVEKTRTLTKLIERFQIPDKNDKEKYCYKCFCMHDWREKYNKKQTVLHEDSGSAWNCMLEHCGKPTHGVIIRRNGTYNTDSL